MLGLKPWKKSIQPFLFFSFSSPNKQNTEHQSDSNSGTPWTHSLWKASLHWVALKKAGHFSPPVRSKVACVKLQKNRWASSTTYNSNPPPGKIIQHSPWTNWIPPPRKIKKHKQWPVIWHWQWRGVGTLNPPQRVRVGQGSELSVI
jgi:hypothetical protein